MNPMRLRTAFLGSPAFAVPSLRAVASRHNVALVLTQPDRPAGRGRRLEPTAVRRAASEMGLEVETYERRRRLQIDERLGRLDLDVLVVVAFGHILRPSTLATARKGAVNVHASLLPRWRGVAPIERALLAGDAITGVTLMALDAGVDTGPLLGQRVVPIAPEDTRVSLTETLADEGAGLLVELLGPWVGDAITAVPQDDARATRAPRVEKSEGRIEWTHDPVRIWRQVRAFHGSPGAFTELAGATLKLHAVRPVDRMPARAPGTVTRADARHGVHVACGGGTLELLEVQLPGKRAVQATALASGRLIEVGSRLGGPLEPPLTP